MNREPERDVSDERLHALVDGELTPADAEALLERLRTDAVLRERVGQIRLGKAMVRHAYAGAAPPPRRAPIARGGASAARAALAAGLVLAGGVMLGWWGHGRIAVPDDALRQLAAQDGPRAEARYVVLHVSSASPQAGRAVLDRAEGILETARTSGRAVTVEIVANSGGLDLLREGVSAHAARIAALRAQFPGLALVACGQTAQRLRDGGVPVQLLPGTTVATSALDEIVLRMQQGWAYVRI